MHAAGGSPILIPMLHSFFLFIDKEGTTSLHADFSKQESKKLQVYHKYAWAE